MFVDSHCHINFEGLVERLPQVLENMRSHDVTHALCVSVDSKPRACLCSPPAPGSKHERPR